MLKRLVLATRNQGKVLEIERLLTGLPLEVVSLNAYPGFPEVEEDCPDFAGNALKKAKFAAFYTKEAALADDSGLEVEALGGEPGVYSARFAGPGAEDDENNTLLLEKLKNLPPGKRGACFKCALTLVLPGGKSYLIEESCPGLISESPRGDGGFGYDPLFIYEPAGKTFAEMSPAEKNKVSHRGKALNRLRILLERLLLPENSSE